MRIGRLSLVPLAIVAAGIVNVAPLSVSPALCGTEACPIPGVVATDVVATDGTYTGEYEYLISFEGDVGGIALIQATLVSGDLAVEVTRGVIDGAGIAAQETRNTGQLGDISASSEMTQRWTGSFDVTGRAERDAELAAIGDMNPGAIIGSAEGITLEYDVPGFPIDMLLIVREVGCGQISGEVGGNYVTGLDDAVQALVGTAPDVETNRWQLTLESRDEALEALVDDAIDATRRSDPSEEDMRSLVEFAADLTGRDAGDAQAYVECLSDRLMQAAGQLAVSRVEAALEDFPTADASFTAVRDPVERLLSEYGQAILLGTPEECLDQLSGWERVTAVLREALDREIDTTTDMATLLMIARLMQLLGAWDAELDARLGEAINRILRTPAASG